MKKKIIIFDMDGVLFDSIHFAEEFFLKGHPGMTGEMYRNMHTGNFHEGTNKYFHLKKPETEEEEKEKRHIEYSEKKSLSLMFKGIKEFLKELHRNGFILVLNTNAYDRNCLPLLERAKIKMLFDFLATAEISKSKIEKFRLIKEKYNIEKKNLLFITDALGNVEEANIAGISTIAVTWGIHDRSFFEKKKYNNLINIVDTVEELSDFIKEYYFMPKYIDIHAHINFRVFQESRNAIIHRALDNNIWIINIGTQYDTSKKAVEMTTEYKEGIYSTIGLHPIHTGASYHDEDELGPEGKEFTSRGEIFNKDKYKALAKEGKVVAIGECGLDYYHLDEESIERQKVAFVGQIELANELNIPLMLHIRNNFNDKSHNAYFDVWELLRDNAKVKGVVHFFAGSVEDMERFIDLGFYISFAGPITYKPNLKICDYERVILKTPMDMIIADTDSPYVAPVPYRGKQNEPSFVIEIVKKIAKVKGLPEEEVAKTIVSNVKRLFDI